MKQVLRFLLCFALALSVCRAEGVAADSTGNAAANSTENAAAVDTSGVNWKDFLAWPFVHILQPVFNVAVYPVAQPIHYAVDNGVIDKAVDLITFGERRNILLYPSMNLKPGTSTMLGIVYRHRGLFLDRDYLVVEPRYYANGDWYASLRYSKQGVFGLPLYAAFRYQQDWDRDAKFIIPGTKRTFTQPDSSINLNLRLSTPLSSNGQWNAEFSTGVSFKDFSLPDNLSDSILVDSSYWVESRGLYQSSLHVPVGLGVVFDNLDFPYAPSRGNRFSFNVEYHFVKSYDGFSYDELDRTGFVRNRTFRDDGGNHDFISTQLVFQHYLYLGQSKQYVMNAAEGRKNRKFYTDFNWDEAVRIWKPENVMTTLFERRVLAFQFRLQNMFEMEKGEAPFYAFPSASNRYPLRGYKDALADYHLMGFSLEYRWPVDKYVDGVIFDEYVLHAPELDEWSTDRVFNSWGFGVRVRRPDMYWFRMQFGFHGLNGVCLVLTIAPEFQ